MKFIYNEKAEQLVDRIEDKSVALIAIDPPFHGIVEDDWDNEWKDAREFAQWFTGIIKLYIPKLTPDGSLVFFAGIGHPGDRAIMRVLDLMETPDFGLTFRHWITWAKKRAYGKEFDYLFCREEILWFSRSPERTKVRFNIPLTDELRGYKGYNKKYPAKSDYKRVTSVWMDIPELFKPSRKCEKPVPIMERIVETHSKPGDLVVDCFAGTGPTGVACAELGRRFIGCEKDPDAAEKANARVLEAYRANK